VSYRLDLNDIHEAAHETLSRYYDVFYETHAAGQVERQTTHAAPPDDRFCLPERFGKGGFCARKIAGATFSEVDLCFSDDTYLTHTTQEDLFYVGATLGSEATLDVAEQRRSHGFQTHMLSLGYGHQGESWRTAMAKEERIHSISFYFTREHMQQCVLEFDRPDLQDQLHRADHMEVFAMAALGQRHRHLISRLTNNPYRGELRKLYFNSVAGELLIAMLESVCVEQPTPIALSQRDRELLDLARTLLLEDVRNPPSIAQLANSVGLNEDKLQKGFKLLFDQTIFKALTEHRMAQALEKLERRDKSIAEIAFEAGYSNVSKFIAAFKKTYGKTPGMIRKDRLYALPRKS